MITQQLQASEILGSGTLWGVHSCNFADTERNILMLLFYRYKNMSSDGSTNWSKISRSREELEGICADMWGLNCEMQIERNQEIEDCKRRNKPIPCWFIPEERQEIEEWHLVGLNLIKKYDH
jgi:hypothetical protein